MMDYTIERERVLSITELTRIIKKNLESSIELNSIWIKGEISNLTLHTSGHIYFSLKDENSVISAVFFKNVNRKLSFKLEDGMSVFAGGGISVYEKRGSYQFNVNLIRLEGIGELQKSIEQLKIKLMKEGIFDPSNKKPIPFFPIRIGVVTSVTGAAFRDIVQVARRRYPGIEIILAPAIVQGLDAHKSIVRGIEELNNPEWEVDIIIAGRGGGSFEDLMPFNEETVVRAFHKSRVPIVSAVGHQIDHPLSDDAADIAAPTPSAAAEIAVPVISEIKGELDYLVIKISNLVSDMFKNIKIRIINAIGRPVFRDPMNIINYKSLVLSDLESRLISAEKDIISEKKNSYNAIPDIHSLIKNIHSICINKYILVLQSVENLSPIGILKRGYSIIYNLKNEILKSTNNINTNDKIRIKLHNGELYCSVDSKKKGVIDG